MKNNLLQEFHHPKCPHRLNLYYPSYINFTFYIDKTKTAYTILHAGCKNDLNNNLLKFALNA